MANLFGKKGFLGLVSIVLTLCLCVGMLVAIPTTVAAEGDVAVWGGPSDVFATLTEAQNSMTGTGTDADPFIITTGKQLYSVIKYTNGGTAYTYKLGNDIYLNEPSLYNDYLNWTAGNVSAKKIWDLAGDKVYGSQNYSFVGTLDGANHTIYGLCGSTGNYYASFIPAIGSKADDNASTVVTIKNLNFKNCGFAGARVGALVVGAVWNTDTDLTLNIENCTVSESIAFQPWSPGKGGSAVIVADSRRPTTISNCSVTDVLFKSSVATTGYANGCMAAIAFGGFASCTASQGTYFHTISSSFMIINNCYSYNVRAEDNTKIHPLGILVEGNNDKIGYCATVNNLYTDADISTVPTYGAAYLRVSTDGTNEITKDSTNYPIKQVSVDIKGVAAKTAMPDLDWMFAWSTVENGYPVPVGYYEAWDGTTATVETAGFGAGQDGSATAPYEITNGKQLYAAVTSNAGYSFVLKNDIYLNKDYKNYDKWAYANSSGTDSENKALNVWAVGANSTFSGTIDGAGYTVYGLFGATTGGDGGLIPYISGAATISNLNVECSLIRCGTRTGILVGRIQSTAKTPEGTTYYPPVSIENVTINRGRLEGLNTAGWNGAMVGYLNAGATTIDNCAVTNVTFGSGNAWNTTNYAEYASFGAFVGANVAGTTYATDSNESAATYSKSNAGNLVVKNSYSFNVTNDIAAESYNIYPVGIQLFYDSANSNPYQHKLSVTLSNVYTDAKLKSFSINGEEAVQIKIADINDISKVVEDYSTVVKSIDSDNMKGLLDSGAWYTGKLSEVSADNLPRLRSNITRFTYADINGDGIDAAYTAADIIPVREYLLGTVDYAYIDGDANASGKIDIRDLVNVYNAVK